MFINYRGISITWAYGLYGDPSLPPCLSVHAKQITQRRLGQHLGGEQLLCPKGVCGCRRGESQNQNFLTSHPHMISLSVACVQATEKLAGASPQ